MRTTVRIQRNSSDGLPPTITTAPPTARRTKPTDTVRASGWVALGYVVLLVAYSAGLKRVVIVGRRPPARARGAA